MQVKKQQNVNKCCSINPTKPLRDAMRKVLPERSIGVGASQDFMGGLAAGRYRGSGRYGVQACMGVHAGIGVQAGMGLQAGIGYRQV